MGIVSEKKKFEQNFLTTGIRVQNLKPGVAIHIYSKSTLKPLLWLMSDLVIIQLCYI